MGLRPTSFGQVVRLALLAIVCYVYFGAFLWILGGGAEALYGLAGYEVVCLVLLGLSDRFTSRPSSGPAYIQVEEVEPQPPVKKPRRCPKASKS